MTHTVEGFPLPLTPSPQSNWNVFALPGRIKVRSLPESDIFIDPAGVGPDRVTSATLHNAATLMTPAPDGDFQLSARIKVDFAATFDAGVLFMRFDERTWAKLCFELSPDKDPMVVSVVNDGVSDDANAFVVSDDSIRLRISRKGTVYAFHASVEQDKWTFVRAFALTHPHEKLEIGFEAQSPNSQGCEVEFSETALTRTTIDDFRDGS